MGGKNWIGVILGVRRKNIVMRRRENEK